MRVAMWYNNNDVRIEEVETPRIDPGELLVKIEASGICGSDVMEWYRLDRAPLVLGHEIGIVGNEWVTFPGCLRCEKTIREIEIGR